MADIRINADQWNALSSDEQNQITQNLRTNGLLKGESRVVPDPYVAALGENDLKPAGWVPPRVCRALCDTAQAAAVAVCVAETAGVALVACLAASQIAGDACRDEC